MTSEQSIYLVYSEKKDLYCLQPLFEPLSQHFNNIKYVDLRALQHNDDLLAEMCAANQPAFLFNSRISIDFISLIMGSKPFISIGLEHGIGPYKKYTYGRHLTKCDIYFAPTKLWADRLIKLYNPPKGSIQVGGYQRLNNLMEEISKQRESMPAAKSRFWKGVKQGERKLAIFSWHFDPTQLAQLPDRHEIVYLLHPADENAFKNFRLKNASVVVSNPVDTAELLAYADLIAGDFSSMTIEAAATGIPTYFFVARSLYKSNCDMDAEFFQEEHAAFAKIPHSDFQLSRNQVCSRAQLIALLEGKDIKALGVKPLDPDSDFLPPAALGDGRYVAASIDGYIRYIRTLGNSEPAHAKDNLDALKFVRTAYRQIMSRDADFAGSLHYLKKMAAPSSSRIANSVGVLNDLVNSDEGRMKWADRSDIPPFFG